jgi:hypothetical protein
MSDYLSRAVERETSATPDVRPALPSLFDPGKTSGVITEREAESPIEGEPSRKAHSEISPAHEPLAAANALWTDAAATSEPTRDDEMAAKKISDGSLDVPVAPSVAPVIPIKSFPSKRQQLPAAERVVTPTTKALPKPPHATGAEPVVTPTTEFPSNQPRAVPAFDERAATSPIARPARGSTEPKSETPPAVAPMTHVVTPTRTTVSPVSPAPSGHEQARNLRAARNDASSPRPIHITIGRVEVRAVHPPPEPVPRRPAPVSPKISLEDYLKQRNGGRR